LLDRLLLALRGRTVTCRICGRPIARLVLVVRDGRVRVLGLGGAAVRLRFTDRHVVAFEHADSRLCTRRIEPPLPRPDPPAG
jgi:hypothetical protein